MNSLDPPTRCRPAVRFRTRTAPTAAHFQPAHPLAARPLAARPLAARPLAAHPLAARPLAARPLAALFLTALFLAALPLPACSFGTGGLKGTGSDGGPDPDGGPSCVDGVKNGDETDVDCGGSCGSCSTGRRCISPTDCESRDCLSGYCVEGACRDNIRNGTETDVDCGGTCPPCAMGSDCIAQRDCFHALCLSNVCTPAQSCWRLLKVKPWAESGTYLIDPDGPSGTDQPVDLYCDMETEGGGWALTFNSVGSDDGTTLLFWQIPYDERMDPKGTASLEQNYYMPTVYKHARFYMDVAVDLGGNAAVLFVAQVAGFDTDNMTFHGSTLLRGVEDFYQSQFASGWSALEHDGDNDPQNCALRYASVTQHYDACCEYNLGADHDIPREDFGWGPHARAILLEDLGLIETDQTPYTRLKRISRFARW